MLHHHHGIMRIVAMCAWLLTALGAINWGLKPLGHNLVERLGSMTSMSIVDPLYYIIGVAGVISLLMLFMACGSKNCKC